VIATATKRKRGLSIHPFFGGKYRLKNWIIPQLPAHKTFIEGFSGAANILLNKPAAPNEYLIEKDYHQYTLLSQIQQNPQAITRFVKSLWLEDFWDWRSKLLSGELTDPTEMAGTVMAIRYLTWGGCRRIYPSLRAIDRSVHWLRSRLENLAPLSTRLASVEIINGDAIDLLPSLVDNNSVAYLDPPYHPECRSSKRVYGCEMDHDDHVALLRTINGLPGKTLLSGYDNPLYKALLYRWRKETKVVKLSPIFGNKSHQELRTECLWMNFG